MQTDVGPFQTVRGLTINGGDLLNLSGDSSFFGQPAFAYDITVNAGGSVSAYAATVSGIAVNAGGQLHLTGGNVSVNGATTSGQVTLDKGSLYNTVVNDGGRILVNTGSLSNTTINAGGLVVFPDGSNIFYTTTDPNGSVVTHAESRPQAADNTIVADGGTLRLEAGSHVADIQNTQLLAGGHIDLADLTYGPNVTSAFDAGTNTLTVGGSATYTLKLAGQYDPAGFKLAADGHGGTLIAATPLCFAKGTQVLTVRGELPIEHLSVGDQVVTAAGRLRRILWIGSSTFIVGGHNRLVLVRKGALPGGAPARDLRVTSGHSLLFGGVLIPAGELVNGRSILWDDARAATVFHVELDLHDVLLADGAPAESFRDDGNRQAFMSVKGSGNSARTTPTCVPVVSRGPIVERTRERILQWASLHPHLAQPEDGIGQSPTVRGSEFVSSSIS